MFGSKNTDTPIVVEVTETDWKSFGDPTNPHHTSLHAMLEAMGGINESVSPGTYHFNAKRVGLKIVLSLDPAA